MRIALMIIITLLVTLFATAARADRPLVVFVFDQTLDGIYRFEDLNGDGDTNDPGEVTEFFDENVPLTGTENSQGLFALGPHTLLATDNFPPDNVVLLDDLDRDGDAFGPGENSVWFDGIVPGGFGLTNPVNLSLGADGAFYLIDNNTLDTANPETVYRLEDLNADGDVLDPGEVTEYFELSPAGVSDAVTFDIEFDAVGAGYVLDIHDPNDIESIDRINPQATAIAEFIDSADLFANTGYLFSGMYELTYVPATNEIIAGVIDLGSNTQIAGFVDRNGSNQIDAQNEFRILWSENLNADGVSTGAARDLLYLADGSLIFVDALRDQVYRLVDLNRDNDYNDLGETNILYSADEAELAGLPALRFLLSCAAAFGFAPGDCDEDGDVDFADFAALVDCLAGPGAPLLPDCDCQDNDDDGDVDMYDFALLQPEYTG
jgi:hypothetical protein